MSRYHENLLYGGGLVFSILIAVVNFLAIAAEFRGFIDERKFDFQNKRAQVLVEVETKQVAMHRGVISAEILWAQPYFSRSRTDLWQMDGREKTGVMPVTLLDNNDELGHRDGYSDILAELAYLANSSFLQHGNALSAYVFSLDKTFVGALLPESSKDLTKAALMSEFESQISELMQNKDVWRISVPRQLLWFPPRRSKLTGEMSFQVAASAFHAGKPFLSVISDMPTSYLEQLLQQNDGRGRFLLLDASGNVVLGADALDGEARKFPKLEKWSRQGGLLNEYFSRNFGCTYRSGAFYFSSKISNTDMTFLHVFSWRDVLEAIREEIVFYVLAAAFSIFLLWGCLLYFNIHIFGPIYKKAQTVFDSENLSRTLVAMAPYGLGLLALNEKKILLENSLMARYREGFVIDGKNDRESLKDYFYHIYHAKYLSGGFSEYSTLKSELVVSVSGVVAELLVTLTRTRYQGSLVILCAFSDITVHKQTERVREEARIAAENANQAKSSFLAAMSHEIRTPLNAILGNLEILGRSHLPEKHKIRLRTISSSSRSLLSLLNDILDFSKIESGQMSVESKIYNLRKVVQQVSNIYRPLALDAGLGFSLNFDDSISGNYWGDAERIKQILSNLLGNAMKFTKKGSIDIAVAEHAGQLEIEVRDTGVGIHPSQQDSIFDAFKQANSEIAAIFGGTGLGLTLCRRMARLMGGEILFSSVPGKGSRFSLVLPAIQAEPAGEDAAKEEGSEELVDMGRQVSVLVVDDHPVNRMLLLDQLEILGCAAHCAENGEVALKKMQRKKYDMVLTDLQMPVMDGYALASQIRKKHGKMPIIAITSYTSDEEKKKCLEHGVSDALFKPVSLGSLSRLIKKYFGEMERVKMPSDGFMDTTNYHRLLVSTAQQSIVRVTEAAELDDMNSALQELHSMKGAFAVAGLQRILNEIDAIEKSLRKGRKAEFLGGINDLKEALTHI